MEEAPLYAVPLEGVPSEGNPGAPAPTLQVTQGLNRAFGFRMEEELERINNAVVEINKFSKDFEEAKQSFGTLLEAAKVKLDKLYLAHRTSIEKARLYYRTRLKAMEYKEELFSSAARYRKACLMFEESRENAAVAEKAFAASTGGQHGTQDPDILSNLNKANEKVLEATRLKDEAEEDQHRCMGILSETDHILGELGRENRKAVEKAKTYYDTRDAYQRQLNEEIKKPLEKRQYLKEAKDRYKDLFARMNIISAEFEQRRSSLDIDINVFRDLSKFQEIEDMGQVVELDAHITECDRRHSVDELSMDSSFSDYSTENALAKSWSLNENTIRELNLSASDKDTLSLDLPSGASKNSSFTMDI